MSTTKELSPPSLSSIEEEVVLARPINGWAILALILGLLSLLTPLSINLVPLSIVAIVFCSVSVLRVYRLESSGGGWMAVVGLGLAVASASWALAAHKTRQNHYAAAAGEFSAEYLNLLSSGLIYNALELKLPFRQRRTTDVDLQAYYEAYTEELNINFAVDEVYEFDDANPANADKARKASVERMKFDPVFQYARKYPNAKWTPAEIRQISSKGQEAAVEVALTNDQDPTTVVLINIARARYYTDIDKAEPVAEWRIMNQSLSN